MTFWHLPDLWDISHILNRKKLAKETEEAINSFLEYFDDFFFGKYKEKIIQPKDYVAYKTHRKKAFQYLEKKDYNKAIKSFTKVMKVDQEEFQIDLRLGKARALAHTKDGYEEAIIHYKKVIQTYSAIPYNQYQISQGQIYYELAYCYVKKGDYSKALACVELALSFAGNMAENWLLKSKIYRELGKLSLA